MSLSWNGMLRVELTGAETERSLSAINERHIPLFHVDRSGELTVSFWIRRGDYRKVSALCNKRGDKLSVLQRRGLYWTGAALLRRPVLICGFFLLMTLGFWLPGRVLFVRVEGNTTTPARQIVAAAEDCGVGFGASRRYVRSEKVKNALLQAVPQLQWAGVNTSGCVAVISVRERNVSGETVAPQTSQLVADRDGYILTADVTRGTAMVRPGQAVKKGQTLVSGYTDCGICIRATGAEGEIFAQTRREIRAVTPVNWAARGATQDVKRKISLLFRKKRINLWKDSGIPDTTCGRMDKEYNLTLPGGFQLPLALCIEEYTAYEMHSVRVDAECQLRAFAADYLKQKMVSGTILNRDETVSLNGEVYALEGTYDCTEMIGRVEKIGETNGKRD